MSNPGLNPRDVLNENAWAALKRLAPNDDGDWRTVAFDAVVKEAGRGQPCQFLTPRGHSAYTVLINAGAMPREKVTVGDLVAQAEKA